MSTKICPRCLLDLKKEDFYSRRSGNGNSSYCKKCTNTQAIERQHKFKELCVTYKGSVCEFCGYNKYIGALEFHHRDPEAKDFSFAHRRSHTFNQEIIDELDKCILLCSNCHKEEHARIRKEE